MATAEYSGDASSRASKTTPQKTDVTLTPISVAETLQLCPCAARVRLAYAVFSAGRFIGHVRSGSPGVARGAARRQSWFGVLPTGESINHPAGTPERAAWLLSSTPSIPN